MPKTIARQKQIKLPKGNTLVGLISVDGYEIIGRDSDGELHVPEKRDSIESVDEIEDAKYDS